MAQLAEQLRRRSLLERFGFQFRGGTGAVVKIGAIVLVGAAVGTAGYHRITPPEGFDGVCTVQNREEWGPTYEPGECDFGATITRNNALWACTGSTVTAAQNAGGQPPLRVQINSSQVWSAAQAVDLNNGCTGDSDSNTIDVFLEIDGNGTTEGVSGDAFKYKPFGQQGPSNLQIAVSADCADAGGGHFDALQVQSTNANGSNLTIVNPRIGDYANGIPTCQGAGGVFFWSDSANLSILGGEVIGCNHGVNGNNEKEASGSRIEDLKVRTGAITTNNCVGVVISDACINMQGVTLVNVTSQRLVGGVYTNSPCTN